MREYKSYIIGLLTVIVIYAGSYYALVDLHVPIIGGDPQITFRTFPGTACYLGSEYFPTEIFRPMEAIDQQLRPDWWGFTHDF